MGFSEAELLNWFTQYAYQAWLIYLGIFVLMMASGFGLPIPEEVTLISSGLVCYVASRPDLYPPPLEGSHPVNPYITAGVAFFSVVFADCLVFFLGKFFGGKILRAPYMARYRERFEKVGEWTKRYGMWAAGAFRFTPGLRFPGHFACGMMGLKVSKFIAVDGIAAAISVPTQVLLVAFYGETILVYFRQFKLALLGFIALGLLYYLARKFWKKSGTPVA
ncbi:MAG: DedA family protein [Chitinophagaceae bacterium]|nr:DedA family protein [Oligoflexus sp.]